MLFTVAFAATLSILTKAGRYDLFAATAAYCAFLVVFIVSMQSRSKHLVRFTSRVGFHTKGKQPVGQVWERERSTQTIEESSQLSRLHVFYLVASLNLLSIARYRVCTEVSRMRYEQMVLIAQIETVVDRLSDA